MFDGSINIYFRMRQCFLWNDYIDVIFGYGLNENFYFFILMMMSLLLLLDCLLLDCSILQFSNIMFYMIMLLSCLSYFGFIFIYAHLNRMDYSRLNLFLRFCLRFRVLDLMQMLEGIFKMRVILPWGEIMIVCMFFHLFLVEIQEYNCLLQILLMQKKIGEISQAFERSKFAQTLSIIEQTLKKNSKQDKKQKQLSNVELKIINWFKVGSLASLGRQHEASIVYQELLTPEGIAIMGKQNPYLLLAISQLFGENKEKQVLELLQKHFPTFDTIKAYRFYLNTRLFSSLSKLLMKEFATTKNSMSQLGQTYCDYLNQINKFDLIEYQRDGWYKYHPDIKASLKLVSMFVEKCIKSSQESKVKAENELLKENILEKEKLTTEVQKSKKIIQRGNQLKLKIAVNQGRVADAIAIYNNIRPNLKLPFTFLRSIVKLQGFLEHEDQIGRFYVRQMEGVFKTNLNFATYTPLYDYYDEFFSFLKETAVKKGINLQQTVKMGENVIPFEQLYSFENKDISAILQEYYNSLLSEFAYLTDTQNAQYATNKKSDYYKICIKGLLLQIISIAHFLNHQATKLKYLKEYTTFFSNTLTYPQELRRYWKELINHEILVNPTEVVNDNQLITQINFRKVWLAVKTVSLDSRQELFKHYDELMKTYNVRVKEIQKSRKLQKGERYISDQFVIILTDYIRSFLQNEQDEAFSQEIISRIVSELEICVQVSSYNADLKLRLMYFLSLLNHHERLIEVYITNDIKSVQMETLGYWYLKAVLEFGTESKYDHFFERLVRSYLQNQRQTSEYGMKALKAGELDRVQEYLAYRTNILNSYNSLVILFMLFHKNRFDNNAHYYLVRINDKINSFKNKQSPLTFNADFKVMNNVLFEDYHFAHLYGLYNHYELLQQQTSVYLHELHLINTLLERPNEFSLENVEPIEKLELRINSFEAASLFNFSDYTFQEEKLNYNVETSKKSLERAGKHLDVYKHLMAVRISNIRLFSLLLNSIKTQTLNQEEASALQAVILANLEKLKTYHKNLDYRSQIRSIILIRRSLFQCHNMLSVIREAVSKNKKLKAIKAGVQNATSKLIQEYYHSILSFRWTQRPSKTGVLVSRRDELMERQLEIDGKQAKRVISKYQNLHKL